MHSGKIWVTFLARQKYWYSLHLFQILLGNWIYQAASKKFSYVTFSKTDIFPSLYFEYNVWSLTLGCYRKSRDHTLDNIHLCTHWDEMLTMNVRSVKSIIWFINLEVLGINGIYFIDGNRVVTYDYNQGANRNFWIKIILIRSHIFQMQAEFIKVFVFDCNKLIFHSVLSSKTEVILVAKHSQSIVTKVVVILR